MIFAAVVPSLGLGCSSTETTGATPAKLTAQCIDDADALEAKDWLCDDERKVECEDGGANPEAIYLEPSGEPPESCGDLDLTLDDSGPFDVGTHDVEITATLRESGEVVETCTSTLNVVDETAPESKDDAIALWPPNHKFHTISGSDCVVDRCDGEDVDVVFHYASSDEPVNAKGDGNTEPDIILACDSVQLRAERQGGSDGRVYKLGWKAVDAAGNPTEGTCVVAVPHDQSGREAVDSTPPGAEPPYQVTLEKDECDDGTGGAGGAGGTGGEGGVGGEGGEGGGVVVP